MKTLNAKEYAGGELLRIDMGTDNPLNDWHVLPTQMQHEIKEQAVGTVQLIRRIADDSGSP